MTEEMRLYKKLLKLRERLEKTKQDIREIVDIMAKKIPIGTQSGGVFNAGFRTDNVSWKDAFYHMASKAPESMRDTFVDDALKLSTTKSIRNVFREGKEDE